VLLGDFQHMLKSLFLSDKAPFILSLALSILGWLITTTITNLSDVVIIGVAETVEPGKATLTITNHSTKKSLVGGLITVTCFGVACFTGSSDGPRLHEIAPYAIKGTKVCSNDSENITAMLSLPPSGQIQIETPLKAGSVPKLMFNGLTPSETSACPTSASSLKVDNVWIVGEPSLIIFLLDYYYHLLFGFILLTLVFLIAILLKSGPTQEANNAQPSL
jgi:hypothetical protein